MALVRLLRHAKLVAAEIAARLPLARSTVSAVLARLGLGRLRYLRPPDAGATLRMAASRRAGPCRHQEARPLRPGRPSGHRSSPHGQRAALGWEYAHVAVDDCSRFSYVEILPDEKRYTATALLAARRARIPAPRHPRSARAYRQRRRLSLAAVSQGLPLARDRHQTHPTLPTPNQRQSRALHPDTAAQMGLRRALRHLRAAPRRLARLAAASTMRNDPMLAFIDKHHSADWLSSLNNGRRNHN